MAPESVSTPSGVESKTQVIQAEVDETVELMRENINQVYERGEQLEAMNDKSEHLALTSQGFRTGAIRVRKQMWWKDIKVKLMIGFVVIVLIGILTFGLKD
ncbi:hypothetical protein CROQUDRAFT_59163 [Cronartium quercuum f. sp. fusiforme G11]|uniref:V-SNARE coiled-coil homology domain-containing protein n=1 Tax=Cronartium quercuum f. sp. fusiforme G11 TaxID=708437 RepID=A0A9P6NUA5_9BASI|nr:hypothetical protein CROQUDRAFT_59163 [Cronartium quercuum f. sp. fusiforme G11]